MAGTSAVPASGTAAEEATTQTGRAFKADAYKQTVLDQPGTMGGKLIGETGQRRNSLAPDLARSLL